MNKIDCRPVVVGSCVWCALPYLGAGIVYQIHGEAAPETIKVVLDGVGVQGGQARYDVVFENGAVSHQLPEGIMRGIQWKLSDEVAGPEQIAAALAHSAVVKAQAAASAEQNNNDLVARIESLKTDPAFSHLSQGDDNWSGKLAAKNIRADLRLKFNGVKFSVRVTHYGSLSIRWEDGPTVAAIKEVVDKYESGSFNGMEDIYEHAASAWNNVYGGVKDLNTNRSFSADLCACAISEVFQKYAANLEGVAVPTAEDFDNGATWYVHVSGANDNLQILIHKALAQMVGR